MPDAAAYPVSPSARDRFVVARRGPRPARDPWRHQGLIVDEEPTPSGGRERVATVFLTGRECPWRCAMCDLWRYTTTTDTPDGAIAAQVAAARVELAEACPPIDALKLYNAGSFFDPRAVRDGDYDGVAAAVAGLSRVVVESHPSLIDGRVDRLLGALDDASHGAPPRLEVAMGLETAHPGALDRLNKHVTLDDFARAARTLADRGVALRLFLLIAPPFVARGEQDAWLLRSIDAAFAYGAAIVSLVPTRNGNGTMDTLAAEGLFEPPGLETIERSCRLALQHARGRGLVFADIWDLDRFASPGAPLAAVRARLTAMNLTQAVAS
jgi:radical SAM enzyme (TIGR01210 family)